MKKIVFLLVVFLFSVSTFAQRHELGVFGGCSFYMGDLNPLRPFELIKPAYGLVYRYNLSPRFAFKLNAYTGTLLGDDAHTKFISQRNLSFKSSILDISPQIELNFIPYVPGNPKYPWSPYIFGGISIFRFNPQAEYKGAWHDLQPLGTEGQGTSLSGVSNPYSLTSVAFPFGFGFKFNIGKKIVLGAEWGMRKTFTDYIDDVSTVYADPSILRGQNTVMSEVLADRSPEIGEPRNVTGSPRGNSKTNDWYSFAGIIITYKIQFKPLMCPAYNKSRNYKEYKLY